MDEREAESVRRPSAESLWLHGLAEQLLWTKLLRAPALALRPQRIVLCFFLLALVGAIGRLQMPWRSEGTTPFLDALIGAKLAALGQIAGGVAALHWEATAAGLAMLLIDVPRLAATAYPVESLVLGLPIMLVWAVLGGAVCRSVAFEFSLGMILPWSRHLGFSLARWRTVLGVMLLPGVVIGLLAAVLAIGGVVLFNQVPVLELLGGVLYGLGLLLGVGAAVVVAAVLLGWPLLLPAAVCEGTDAIDSVGRVFAYVVARPLRLVWYLAVAGAVCGVAAVAALALLEGGTALTEAAAGSLAPAQGVAEMRGAFPPEAVFDEAGERREIGALAAASSWVVGFWVSCVRLVGASYVLSLVLTAGTMTYLFMRQVCDGQHYAELWVEPGRGGE